MLLFNLKKRRRGGGGEERGTSFLKYFFPYRMMVSWNTGIKLWKGRLQLNVCVFRKNIWNIRTAAPNLFSLVDWQRRWQQGLFLVAEPLSQMQLHERTHLPTTSAAAVNGLQPSTGPQTGGWGSLH